MSKVCYLSVNSFLMKPTQRILYYRSMLASKSTLQFFDRIQSLNLDYGYKDCFQAKILAPMENSFLKQQ